MDAQITFLPIFAKLRYMFIASVERPSKVNQPIFTEQLGMQDFWLDFESSGSWLWAADVPKPQCQVVPYAPRNHPGLPRDHPSDTWTITCS